MVSGAACSMPLAALADWGCTLVVCPHADDEVLGCGGLIALLARFGQPVRGVLVSDCSQSHPRSLRHDAAARNRVRRAEWQCSMACLGVPAENLHALNWPDGSVPGPGHARFDEAVGQVQGLLRALEPRTVVLPWRRDPHPDHRASHALFMHALAAIDTAGRSPTQRRFEYMVWLEERGTRNDLPRPTEMLSWTLDVSSVIAEKRRAIACHRSQHGGVFTDDPEGFTLPPGLLTRALGGQEHLLEPRSRDGMTPALAHQARSTV